jgi:hypothetical protein
MNSFYNFYRDSGTPTINFSEANDPFHMFTGCENLLRQPVLFLEKDCSPGVEFNANKPNPPQRVILSGQNVTKNTFV